MVDTTIPIELDGHEEVCRICTVGGDEVSAVRFGERDFSYCAVSENIILENDERTKVVFRIPNKQVVWIHDKLTYREELYDDIYGDWSEKRGLNPNRMIQSDTAEEQRVKTLMDNSEVMGRARRMELVPETRERDYRERLAWKINELWQEGDLTRISNESVRGVGY